MVLATVALLLHLAWAPPAAPDVSSNVVTEPATVTPTTTTSTAPSSSSESDRSSTDSKSPKLTVVSLESASQNSQSLATVRVPSIEPATPKKVIPVENLPSRRNWLILSIVQHSAATFDAYSTRQAVSSGAVEADPFMRPFAQSPAIYVAIQGAPVVLDYAARRMQRSPNNFLRHTWWLPQSASTGLFLFSGVHNLHVANRP
jgi:hypothetical protein